LDVKPYYAIVRVFCCALGLRCTCEP